MQEGKLRFGVLCHGTSFKAWQARCLRQLLEIPGVEPALLIVDADSPPPQPPSLFRAAGNILSGRTTAWHLYARRMKGQLTSSRTVSMEQELAGVPRLECRTQLKGRWSHYFTDEDVERIRQHRLDFILRFAFEIIRGKVLDAAEYGVWSFHHGDPAHYRGGPACFWEVYDGAPLTGAILQRLTHRLDAGVILHQGTFGTDRGMKAYSLTCNKVTLGAASWPAHLCRQILSGNDARVRAGTPCRTTAPIRHDPSPWQSLRFLARCVRKELALKVRWLFREEQWNIGYAPIPIHKLLAKCEWPEVRWYRKLPRHQFLADPMATRFDGRVAIIAEHYDYRTRKGTLRTLALENGRPAGEPALAIEEPWHLAYPYLVHLGADLYCIPEGIGGDCLWAYRAREFPTAWERIGPLIDKTRIVDPTLFEHEGRWWLLGMRSGEYREQGYVELHGWYADSLMGPWQPHLCNPIKTDVRNSRPAGPPFYHAGKLYRPTQDCCGEYGSAVAINEVLTLSPTEFEERQVTRLTPHRRWPYSDGVHTLCPVEGGVIIDARRWIFIPHCFWGRLRALLFSSGSEYARSQRTKTVLAAAAAGGQSAAPAGQKVSP
jgi:hypothetical protein